MNAGKLLWLGLALLAAGCGARSGKPDGSGTIECTQVQVAPQVAGRVAELLPQEGAALKAGDLVARLDARDYELKRDEARAALASAQAQLDLLKAGARIEDVERAREAVREARAAATAATADRKRIEEVFAQGSATQKQLDDVRATADRTAAALAGAGQNLARLEHGNRPEEIRIAETQVELAKTKLAQNEKNIADCVVYAPMAGVVTTRSREPGEWVTPGAPLVMLSRLDEVWLAIYIPEDRLSRVKLGQPAFVRLDGDPQRYVGVVTFISPQAEFTPKNVQTPDERAKLVYRVKITLKNPNGLFKPGLPADGFLEK
ncbi:MAG: HlyD family efflux transporter periplasmic adaptor subunit [Verrucomicrobia bacterium]|nr:MAG: HlyD family efflux transporter periplasmic adaptor subunit [Verrucomicrobiota bacterium]